MKRDPFLAENERAMSARDGCARRGTRRMADDTQQILDDAVARNLGIVLSLPSAGMLRHHKSRFLAVADDGIWIECPHDDRALIDDLMQRKLSAAVSFKSSVNKTSFVSQIVKRDDKHQINAQTVVEALLISRPAEIKSVQRRTDYRVRLHESAELSVKIWRIAEQADLQVPPSATAEVKVQMRDISSGGMGITVFPPAEETATMAQKMGLMSDERLRIELRAGEHQLIIEGRVRHAPRNDDKAIAEKRPQRVGVQFSKLGSDLEGRRSLATLTRIIGEMQREEARRARLGMINGEAAA
jgi:c-di-GMP-binding flagellar brake protein YcgR